MPLYEYRCDKCGRSFEKLRRIQDADGDVQCPYCESEKVQRELSSFATSGDGGGGCASPAGRSRFR
jgi:putative FmdB family regulatory protein